MQSTANSFTDIVNSVARKHDIARNAMSDIIRSVFSEIRKNVVEDGRDVSVPDFGKFKKRDRAALTTSPAYTTISYSPSSGARQYPDDAGDAQGD